jgi:hypothetical protein
MRAAVQLGLGGVQYSEPVDDVLAALTRAQRQPRWLTLACVAALAVAFVPASRALAGHGSSIAVWTVTDALAALMVGLGWWVERRHGTVELRYRFDAEERARWERLVRALATLSSTTVWHATAQGAVDDPKYHAGASHLLDRRVVRPTVALPESVASNVLVPSLEAGDAVLWFFPDHLLVYRGADVAAVPYAALDVESATAQFLEGDRVPSDAQVIEQTAFFRRRSGALIDLDPGPHVPLCLYGRLELQAGDLRATFICSRPELLREVAEALAELRRHGDGTTELRRRSEVEALLRRLTEATDLIAPYLEATQAADWQSACDAATRIEGLVPMPMAFLWRGASLARLGRWSEAERDLLRAYEGCDRPYAWLEEQAVVFQEPEHAAAFAEIVARWRAIALPLGELCHHLAVACLRTGRPRDALAWAERAALHGYPPQDARAVVAEASFEAGEYDEALRAYRDLADAEGELDRRRAATVKAARAAALSGAPLPVVRGLLDRACELGAAPRELAAEPDLAGYLPSS